MKLILVGIGGPSSSGKTTVAKGLHLLFPKSTLIHLDDFYFPDDQIPYNAELDTQNWDCAEAIDWGSFKMYIAKVRETSGAILPMQTLEADLNLKLSELEVDLLKKLAAAALDLSRYHFVFVDGFMLYHDDEILRLFDVKLFFNAPYQVLKVRRESRQGYNTVAGFWVDPPNYFDNVVWPEFKKSHEHLFVDGDVEGILNERSRRLGLVDVTNDGSKSLMELISRSLEEICRQMTESRS